MRNCVSEFIESRMEEIAQDLLQNNSVYCLAVEKGKSLFESIDPIMQNESDMSISAGDCINFREYFEQELEAAAIMQKEVYQQGYLDCVKLLLMLGILNGEEARP